jgi:hypothetical protein
MKIQRPGVHNTTQPFYEQTGIHSPVWVIGSIDCHGAIHARHAARSENILHGVNEKNGRRWRWNIQDQRFVATVIFDEDLPQVVEYLESRGYKKPGELKPTFWGASDFS